MANTNFSNLKELLSNSNNIFLGKGKLTYSDPSGKLSGKDEDVTVFIFAHDKVRQNVVFIKDEITLLYKSSIDEHALADIKSALKLFGMEPVGTLTIKDTFKVTITADYNDLVSAHNFRSLSKKQLEDVCKMLSIELDKSFKYNEITISNKNTFKIKHFTYSKDTNPCKKDVEDYVVNLDDHLFVLGKEARMRTKYFKPGNHIIYEGDPGAGKTEEVKAQAKLLGRDFVLIPCHDGLIPSDLLGEPQPDDSPTVIKGEDLKAVIDGKKDSKLIFDTKNFTFRVAPFAISVPSNVVICLDELSRAPYGTQSVLLSLLDKTAYILLPNGKVVHLGPDTIIVATGNLQSKGAYGLIQALRSRFTFRPRVMSLLKTYSDKKKDAEAKELLEKVIVLNTGFENKKLVSAIADLSRETLKLQEEQDLENKVSYREVDAFIKTVHAEGTGELLPKDEVIQSFVDIFINIEEDQLVCDEMFKQLKPVLEEYITVASAKTEADIGTYNSPISSLDSKADDIVNNILGELDEISTGGTL